MGYSLRMHLGNICEPFSTFLATKFDSFTVFLLSLKYPTIYSTTLVHCHLSILLFLLYYKQHIQAIHCDLPVRLCELFLVLGQIEMPLSYVLEAMSTSNLNDGKKPLYWTEKGINSVVFTFFTFYWMYIVVLIFNHIRHCRWWHMRRFCHML